MDLDLLLAYADDMRPVLEDGGLPFEAATSAVSSKEAKDAQNFLDFSGEPNDLTLQRWALIAEEGPEGDHLLDLVKPLRKTREEEQGAEVKEYRVPRGMDTTASIAWMKNVFRDESVDLEDLPRYLMILGDLDRVSLELQQAFGGGMLVGRLACPNDEGYDAYVNKVLRWEREPSAEEKARALFFTARDGTAATTIGYRALVSPSMQRCAEKQKKGTFPAREVQEIAYESASQAKDEFFTQLAAREPSMLFTMSHGLGTPRKGWTSVDEQRAIQGAMSLGSGLRITAEEVVGKPFLPGGIWFFLACYGGGTPAASAYYHWLSKLRDAGGFGGRVDSVLAGLPKPGEAPFIAALPQAAIANPDGPLAIMAHLDLAWTYSFQDLGAGGQDRPSRYEGIFRSLVNGRRAGLAHNELLAHLFDTSEVLAKMLNDETARELAGKPMAPDAAREANKANLWMLRQDLAGYILLGDPAVRLPLARRAAAPKTTTPEVRSAAAATATPAEPPAKPAIEAAIGGAPVAATEAEKPAPGRRAEEMEEAVLAMLEGSEGDKKIAERFGVSRAELKRWVDTYQEAGRAALAKLR